VMTNCGGNFVLAGFAGEVACLATAIDAYHRGHRFTYLHDASASHQLDGLPASDVQRAVTAIVNLYDEATTTDAWIEATTRQAKTLRRGA
jgi:nicotinamidase-related amidase